MWSYINCMFIHIHIKMIRLGNKGAISIINMLNHDVTNTLIFFRFTINLSLVVMG